MKQKMTAQVRREIARWIVQAAFGPVAYDLILFLAAGKLEWIWAWAQLNGIAAFLAAHPLLLIPINPELTAEREKGVRAEGVNAWDKWVAALAAGALLPLWVVAGLDARFHWTGPMPPCLHLGGLLANALGHGVQRPFLRGRPHPAGARP